jgi:cold shock CspA family protein
MAKSQETFNKKEKEKKRRKKKQDKLEKREQRKAEKQEGGAKSFEEMLAYVDENGNLSDTPPDPLKKKKIVAADIVLGAAPKDDTPYDPNRKGLVKFFNDEKGYGFLIDQETKESIFVHINNVNEPIGENDKVSFQVEMGPKGPNAVQVKKLPKE